MPSRRLITLTIAGMLSGSACDGGVSVEAGNPMPILTGPVASILVPGGSPTQIEVLGLGFVSSSVARWGGDPRPTSVHGPTRLTVVLGPGDLAAVGPVDVTVENPAPGGGVSEPISVLVGHPVPTITSVAIVPGPNAVTAGMSLRIQGSGFATNGGAEVRWNGLGVPTTSVSGAELVAFVADYLVREGGTVRIEVFNPPPGGGSSAVATFAWDNPVPMLDAVEPTNVWAATSDTVAILGSGFVAGARVVYGSVELVPVFSSPTRLLVVPSGTLHVALSQVSVQVRNPAPGGGTTAPLSLPVWALPPRVDVMFPSRAEAGAPAFGIQLFGRHFWPTATVSWGGQTRSVTVLDSATISWTVLPGDIDSAGDIEVVVTNPTPGGETRATFTVLPQRAPVITSLVPVHLDVGTVPPALIIRGSQFAAGAVVEGNGAVRPATVIDAQRIEVPVSAADVAAAAIVELRVRNPIAGASGPRSLHVLGPVPNGVVLYERLGGVALETSGLDGSNRTVLVSTGGTFEPDASPVDRAALFVRAVSNGPRVFMVDPAGVVERVTDATQEQLFAFEYQPRFSSDGDWIYFTAVEGIRRAIWRARRDRTALERVHLEPSSDVSDPSPSSAGDRLTFRRWQDDRTYVFDLNDGSIQPLGVRSSGTRWSPDDAWIAYVDSGRLWVIRPDGSGAREVAPGAQFGARFDWSPTGDHIVGTTPFGDPQLVAFPSGIMRPAPNLPTIGAVAWFDNP